MDDIGVPLFGKSQFLMGTYTINAHFPVRYVCYNQRVRWMIWGYHHFRTPTSPSFRTPGEAKAMANQSVQPAPFLRLKKSPKSIQELGFMDGLWMIYEWFIDCLWIFLVPNIVFLMMFNEYISGGIEMNELRWCHDHAANGGIKSPFTSTLIVKKYGTRFHHMVYRHFPAEMGVNGCTLWLRQNSELENLHKNSGFSMIFPL